MKKKENLLVSIGFNIIIPVLLLTKLNKYVEVNPVIVLVLALLFPISYALYDFVTRKNFNVISALGFISTLLTGVIGLIQMDPIWIAVKEAAIPFIIGIFVLATINSKKNIVSTLLFNESLLDISRVNDLLEQNNKKEEFNKVVKTASKWVAFSFFVSTILNFTLARIIVVTQPINEEAQNLFNSEVGSMTGYSYLVIAIPCSLILFGVMFFIFKQIKRLTGLSLEEIMKK